MIDDGNSDVLGQMNQPRYKPEIVLLASLDEVAMGAKPWEFAMRLHQLKPGWPESEQETLQLENEILHLQSTPPWRNPTRRFGFEFKFTDGSVWPDFEHLNTPEVAQYLRARVGIAKHPALRARYGDLLWEISSDHAAARTAVESYLAYAGGLLDGGQNLYGADAIARATDLALRLNDTPLASAAVSVLMQRLESAAGDLNENACSWLAEALLSVGRSASKDQMQHAAELLERVAAILAQESAQAFAVEDLYQKAGRVRHALGDTVGEKTALRRAAECIEARARISEQDSHMRSAYFYRKAQAAYQRLGDRSKVEEMRAKMREQSKLAEQHEFAVIQTKVSWPTEQISKWVADLRRRPLDESLIILSQHPDFSPSLEHAESEWRAVFQQFVTPTVQRNGLPVWTALTPEEIHQYYVLQAFLQEMSRTASLVCYMLREVLVEVALPAPALADWLLTRPLYAGTDKGILAHALEYYFSRDWIGALHVLPEYIENLLRLVLKKIGLVTFSATRGRSGAFREKDLDTVLQTEDLRKGLGEDMCVYVALVLTDPRGPQLRHMVAHGLLNSNACTESKSNLLIHLLMLLARYEIRRLDDGSASETPKSPA